MESSKSLGVMLEPTNMRQNFFTNILLLGFDPSIAEAKYKIPFTRDMFALPNKKGFEVVIYFLFEKLNPVMCKERFRDCWPVTDKKEEQHFRRTCNDWLAHISKDETDANLPRIVASLFMSPGGDRFYELMFSFSRFVLQRAVINDNGVKSRDMIRQPSLTPQAMSIGNVMAKDLQCAVVRHRRILLNHCEEALVVQNAWTDYVNILVKENRALTKKIREKEHSIQQDTHLTRPANLKSPMNPRRSGLVEDYQLDVEAVHRSQRVQKVRELWAIFDDFCSSKENEINVVSSILDGVCTKYKIDSSELNIKVPDLLLRECEQELIRRQVDNIYNGGKLNLVNLLNLWNLSLHLYIEKLHQVGVPKLQEQSATIATHVHVHHAHLTNAKTLRRQLGQELLPELKESVSKLRDEIYQDMEAGDTKHKTPLLNKKMSVRAGLLPPTPPVTFCGDSSDSSDTLRPERSHMTSLSTTLTPDKMSTPEAASRLQGSVERKIRKTHTPSSLVQGVPMYEPLSKRPSSKRKTSRLPQPTITVEHVGNKQRTRVKSAPARAHTPPVDDVEPFDFQQDLNSESNLRPSPEAVSPKREAANQLYLQRGAVTTVKKKKKLGFQRPTVEQYNHAVAPSTVQPALRAEDILADQIANAVVRESPEQYLTLEKSIEELHIEDPLSGLGREAFVSKDKLTRSPDHSHGSRQTWHEMLTNGQNDHKKSFRSDMEDSITVLDYVPSHPLTPSKDPTSSHYTYTDRPPHDHSSSLLDATSVLTQQKGAHRVEKEFENRLLNSGSGRQQFMEERTTRYTEQTRTIQNAVSPKDKFQRRMEEHLNSLVDTDALYTDQMGMKTPLLPKRGRGISVEESASPALPRRTTNTSHGSHNGLVHENTLYRSPLINFTSQQVPRESLFSEDLSMSPSGNHHDLTEHRKTSVSSLNHNYNEDAHPFHGDFNRGIGHSVVSGIRYPPPVNTAPSESSWTTIDRQSSVGSGQSDQNNSNGQTSDNFEQNPVATSEHNHMLDHSVSTDKKSSAQSITSSTTEDIIARYKKLKEMTSRDSQSSEQSRGSTSLRNGSTPNDLTKLTDSHLSRRSTKPTSESDSVLILSPLDVRQSDLRSSKQSQLTSGHYGNYYRGVDEEQTSSLLNNKYLVPSPKKDDDDDDIFHQGDLYESFTYKDNRLSSLMDEDDSILIPVSPSNNW